MIRYIYPSGNETQTDDKKFSTEELKALYKGRWFTLSFAYDEKNEDGTFTDYYMCRLDTFRTPIKDLPEFNESIMKEFRREAYGVVVIAPSTCF